MVDERVILLRIEHLEHGAGRIAVEIARQLVDLVEHEDRVLRGRAPDAANDVARQRADVGAPMPADLGLVAHATQ